MKIDIGLLNGHEAIMRRARENIDLVGDQFHDVGTQDSLTAVLEKHEKSAWMLRSYLG